MQEQYNNHMSVKGLKRSVVLMQRSFISIYCMISFLVFAGMTGCTKHESSQVVTTDSVKIAQTDTTKKLDDDEGSDIILSAQALRVGGVQMVTLEVKPIQSTVSGPARIVPSQSGEANVGTTVAGRISKLFVKEGAVVRQGSPLAEVSSFELTELKSEYLKAHAEVLKTEKRLARQRQLAEEKLGAKRDLEDAESDYAQAVARRGAAATKLKGLGIDPTQIESSGTATIIRSPINGVVSKRFAGLGDYAEPNKDIFGVLNLSTVWADAQLPVASAAGLQVGGSGYFQTHEGQSLNGRIIFVAPSADPASHTITVRLEVANPTLLLKPETFGTAFFESNNATSTGFAVPASALEKDEDKYYVYRQLNDTTFGRVLVTLVKTASKQAVITSDDLEPNVRIVSTGVFYLKSARLKDELQESD